MTHADLPPLRLVTLFGVVALSAQVGLVGCDSPSVAGNVTVAPPPVDDDGPPGYVLLPEVAPLSAAAALELRLAALQRDVAHRMGAHHAASLVPFGVDELGEELSDLVESRDHKAAISIHIRDLETQRVLFDSIGNTPLNPASNQKLLTSAAALDLLGPDYRFSTEVYRQDNTLYLRGTGDPTLNTDDLLAMATGVAELVDMASVSAVVVDDSAFTPRRFGPGYNLDGPGEAYQAPSGALSLNFNTVEVSVFPVGKDPRPTVALEVEAAHLEVENLAWAGRRGGIAIRTRGEGDKTIIQVRGSMSRRARPFVERRRVDDPGLYTGSAFAAMVAAASSSEVLAVDRGVVPESAELVFANESRPLLEVVESGLAFSNNFIAEQVLRTVAWRMTGDPGDWDAGQAILNDYWVALGNDPEHLVVENASGLSREGRLTTAGLVDLISVAYRVHDDEDGLIDALPVAGEPGTLRSRLRMSGKRVRAKTGTLNGVSGLTGVITSEQGEPQIAFSILTNVHEGVSMTAAKRRRTEDRVVMAVLHALDDYSARRAAAESKAVAVAG